MREFIKKNKKLVVLASFLLILGSALFSAWKVFSPTTFEEESVFLDVYGNEIVVPETEPATPQIPLLSNIILTAIITTLLVGGWFLVKKLKGKRRPPVENKKDRIKKNDLKRIQEALGLYYRLRQRYPEAGDEFREIVKDLKPPLEGSVTDYHYENPESDTQRYRLWCFLEDKNDPEAKEGLYELASDKTAA